MSKNFEEEYKALANEELPDLWNRIEAGLTPKTTALPEETKEQVKEQTKKQGRGKVFSFLYKYRTVAAAAVCVVIIIPAVIMLGRIGRMGRTKNWEAIDEAALDSNMSAAQSMDETTAVTEGWDESASEESAEAEAADMEFDDSSMESAAMDMAEEEMAAESGGGTRDVLQNDTGSSGSSAIEDLGDAGKKMDADRITNAEKKSEDKSDDIENQYASGSIVEAAREEKQKEKVRVYENITVKVTGFTEETVETERNMFYGIKVTVVKDPAGELMEGTEITVWVSYLSSMAYLKGETYTLKLSYDPDRECPYRIA